MTGPTVSDLFDRAVERSPGAPAVRDAAGTWTYGELDVAARAAGAGLAAHGVRRGDRVMVRLAGGREFAAVLYGALRVGATVVPVHPATGPFHLRWMLSDAAPAVVVTTPEDPVGALGDPGARIVGPDDLTGAGPEPADGPGATDLALLMYTSGSTGMPRAVACPHERVRFAVDAVAARLRYTADDVILSRVPVSFDYGLYQLFLGAHAGAAVVLRPDLVEAATLREARRVGATVLPVVPTLAQILIRLAARDPRPTRVRLLTNTGAALGVDLAGGLRRVFPDARVVPMYGMTECKRITIAEPDEDVTHPGTVGRALDGTEVLVVDADGNPAPPGVTGEIRVRGPHVMAGYWRSPDATAQRFADGPTLRTGDHGYLDADGRLYFVGRHDDMFKRRGVRMTTREVETATLDVPGVVAAAVPTPGPDGTLSVYVVGDTTPDKVLAALGERVDAARVPDRCVVLPELPTTANGKVDKDALRRAAGGTG